MSEPLTVLRGTLDVLVLKALTWGPMHGFEITAWIEARATGNLDIVDSALNDADNSSVVTFTFSEATTNFILSDIIAVGGTVSGLTGSVKG